MHAIKWLLGALLIGVLSFARAEDSAAVSISPYPAFQSFPRVWLKPDGESMPLEALLEEACLNAGITYVPSNPSPLAGLSAVFDGKPMLLADLIHRIEVVSGHFAEYRSDVLRLQPEVDFQVNAIFDKRTEAFLQKRGAHNVRALENGMLVTMDPSALARVQASLPELKALTKQVIADSQPLFTVTEGQDIATILHGWAMQQNPRWFVNYEAEHNFVVQTPNQFHAKNIIEAVQQFFDSLPSTVGLRAEVGRDNRVIVIKQEGRP